MEKHKGNNITLLMKNNCFPASNKIKNETYAKLPYGLKSNDFQFEEIDKQLIDKYNRDIDNIRKLQKQGIIRKLTKNDSLNLRKNISQNEKNEILNESDNIKQQNPFYMIRNSKNIDYFSELNKHDGQISKNFNFQCNNPMERKISLYSKLHFSLQKFMTNHSKELILQGNKRFQGKSGDYYLHSKNGVVNKLVDNIDVSSLYNSNKKNNAPIEIIKYGVKTKKNDSIEKIITFNKKTVERNNLTPIPLVQKKKLKNQTEKVECNKAERTAVQIRRIEYASAMKEKANLKNKIKFDPLKINAAIKIQNWWRIISFRNHKIILIQSQLRGYLSRKVLNELISYANILSMRIIQLNKSILIPIIKPFFTILYDNYALKSQNNDFLKIVIFLQTQIRKFLLLKGTKNGYLYNGLKRIQDILNKKKREFLKQIKITKIGILKRQKRCFKFNKGFELIHKYCLRRNLNQLSKYAKLIRIVEKRLFIKYQIIFKHYFGVFSKNKKGFPVINVNNLCKTLIKVISHKAMKNILHWNNKTKALSALVKNLILTESINSKLDFQKWFFSSKKKKENYLNSLYLMVNSFHNKNLERIRQEFIKWKIISPKNYLIILRTKLLKNIICNLIKSKHSAIQNSFAKLRRKPSQICFNLLKGLGKLIMFIKLLEEKKFLFDKLTNKWLRSKKLNTRVIDLHKIYLNAREITLKNYLNRLISTHISYSNCSKIIKAINSLIIKLFKRLLVLLVMKKLNKIKANKLKLLIINKSKFDIIEKEKFLTKFFSRFLRAFITEKTDIFEEFINKVNHIKNFIIKLELILKKKTINFNYFTTKLKDFSNTDKLCKILIKINRNKEIKYYTYFLNGIKRRFFNLNKEKRKYIIKSIIKTESFKKKFNEKKFSFNIWSNFIIYQKEKDQLETTERQMKNFKEASDNLMQLYIRKYNFFEKFRHISHKTNQIRNLRKIYKTFQNKENDLLKSYFIIWRENLLLERVKELKQIIIKALFKNLNKKRNEITLKQGFLLWKSETIHHRKMIKKKKKIEVTNIVEDGMKRLISYVNYKLIKYLKEIFHHHREKIVLKSSRKVVKIREKTDSSKKKKYFVNWQKYLLLSKMKHNSRMFIGNTIKSLVRKILNNKLLMNLRLWKEEINNLLKKEEIVLNRFLELLKNLIVNSSYNNFLDNLKNEANSNEIKKRLKKIYDSFDNKDSDKLQYYFRKFNIFGIKISNKNKLRGICLLNLILKYKRYSICPAFSYWKYENSRMECIKTIKNIIEATQLLKNNYIRNHFYVFKNECCYMWPKVLIGTSPQDTIKLGRKTTAKVMYLRNAILLRKYFFQIRKNGKKKNREELGKKLLAKMITKNDKLIIKKILSHLMIKFYRKTQGFFNNKLKYSFASKLTNNFTKKHMKNSIQKYFKIWRKFIQFMKEIEEKSNKLMDILYKFRLKDLYNKLKEIQEINFSKKASTKKIFRLFTQKNNKELNLLKYFGLLKKINFLEKLTDFKKKMFHFLIKRLNTKNNQSLLTLYLSRLKKSIGSQVKITFLNETIKNLNISFRKIISSATRKPFKSLINSLKKIYKINILKQAIFDKSMRFLLKNNMRKWLLIIKNVGKSKLKVKELIYKAFIKKLHFMLFAERICNTFNILNHLRKNYSDKLKSLFRKNLQDQKNKRIYKRNSILNRIVDFYSVSNESVLKRIFFSWGKKSKNMVMVDSMNLINKIASKILILRKRKALKFIISIQYFYINFLKKRKFDTIFKASIYFNKIKEFKEKIIAFTSRINNNTLLYYYKKWGNKVKKINEIIHIEERMINIIMMKYDNSLILQRKFLNKFKEIIQIDQIKDSAKLIKQFLEKIADFRRNQFNKKNLKILFSKALRFKIISQVVLLFNDLLKTSEKINDFVIKIIVICKNKSFYKLKFHLKISLLKKIMRKKLRKYTFNTNFSKFIFKRWKKFTIDKINKCDTDVTRIIHSVSEKKQALFKNYRKTKFLTTKFDYFGNYYRKIERLYFYRWVIYSKTHFFTKKALLIQKFIRVLISKRLVNCLYLKKNIHELYKKNMINMIKDSALYIEMLKYICESYRGRICKKIVNYNLIVFSKLGNMKRIIEFIHDTKTRLSIIKNLLKWKNYVKRLENSIKKLQKNFRIIIAKIKTSKLIMRNHLLINYLRSLKFKLENNIGNTHSIIFKKWLNNSILDKFNEKAKLIQKFIRENKNYHKEKNINFQILKNIFEKYIYKAINGNFRKIKSIIILIDILKKLSNKENFLFLIFLFKKWKENMNFQSIRENSANKISGIFRSCRAKRKTENLRKREFNVSKLISIIHYRYNQKLKVQLIKWYQVSKIQKINRSVKIIQKFIKSKKRICKMNKFFNLANKFQRNELLTHLLRSKKHSKIIKFCSLISYKVVSLSIEKIKQRNKFNFIEKQMLPIKEMIISGIKIKSSIRNRSQKLIANHYRKIRKIFRRTHQLKKILIRLYNVYKEIMRVFLIKWINNDYLQSLIFNSQIIQRFCFRVMNNCRNIKFHMLKELFERAINPSTLIKCLKYISVKLNKMKKELENEEEIKSNKILSFPDNKDKINSIFEILCKIFKYKMKILLDIIFSFIRKKVKEKFAAIIIQKFLRFSILKVRQRNKKKVFAEILLKKKYLYQKNMNSRYISIWKQNSMKIKLNTSATIITKSVKVFQKKLLAKIKLKKLFEMNFIKKLVEFSNLVTKMTKINKMLELANLGLGKFIKLVLFKKIKFISNMKEILIRFINRNENKRLNFTKYLKLWRSNLNKIKLYTKLFQMFSFRYFDSLLKEIKAFNFLSNLKNDISKFTYRITRYVSMRFHSKLLKYEKEVTLYKKLKWTLIKACKEINNAHSNNFFTCIHKIFCFKIINLLVILNRKSQHQKLKYSYELLKKNYYIPISFNLSSSYSKILDGSHQVKSCKINFKSNKPVKVVYNNYLLIISPFFFNYIDTMFKDRIRNAFEKTKITSMHKKGLKKLLSIDSKNIKKSGSGFLEVFKFHYTKTLHIDKIRGFARKHIISHFISASKLFNKFFRLVYLLRITYMNCTKAQKLFNKQLIQKWRFLAVLKKTAKRKMRLLYKNVNQLYHIVAEDIYGNNQDSLRSNFTKLTEKLGTFNQSSIENTIITRVLDSNCITKAKRKYIFNKKKNILSNKPPDCYIYENRLINSLTNEETFPNHQREDMCTLFINLDERDKKKKNDSILIEDQQNSLSSSFNNTVDLKELIDTLPDVK